ncbi:tetraacyldisaccharide 4'-kinase [Zavarzinia compransoris]|uniref:tetraacyldisaccharide 4'-kinase n=1 Tax=Zavarzinia marina TaxID=2911065 RepID=UPI001F331347|nr:tetraacyldisaccharide 4'-kinase [Zavarzinia marina]MCF4164159.1 tetraacyldisaccharide 4'-kinase [Zavarzinia marina]
MRAPEFWAGPGDGGWPARLLSPLSLIWCGLTRRRLARGPGYDPGVPVICIGNVTAGGTGKTPFAMVVARRLAAMGRQPHFLSRGHGARITAPLRVAGQGAATVGDEPLLLSRVAPAWVCPDRAAGARAMVAAGADVIVMDDGFQNPSLAKRLSFLVIDGGAGLGNGRVIPAGPLREPWGDAIARAEAVVVVGTATAPLPDMAGRPVLSAAVVPLNGDDFRGRRVLAFAGIGRPAKFFETLAATGADVVAGRAFADHHPFAASEIADLKREAAALDAVPVTTAKDFARLDAGARAGIEVLEITLALDAEGEAHLDQLLASSFHE